MKFLPILLLNLFCLVTKAQYFDVQTISEFGNKYYKIKEKGDHSDKGNSYPINFLHAKYSSLDTMAMIDELLRFEGDSRLCILKVTNYSALSSQLYTGKSKQYSLQVEALFIINQLYFQKPFYYSPFPVLFDKKNQQYLLTTESQISEVYSSYKKWFAKLRKLVLKRARHEQIEPLSTSNIIWLR